MLVERLEEVESKIASETARLEALRQTIARIEKSIAEKKNSAQISTAVFSNTIKILQNFRSQ